MQTARLLLWTWLSILPCLSAPLGAQEPDPLEALEQRLHELQAQVQALQAEISALRARQPLPGPPQVTAVPAARGSANGSANAPSDSGGATVELGARGLWVESRGGDFRFGLRGLFQFDSRTYLDDAGLGGPSGFQMRRIRPTFELAAFRNFEFRLTPDYAGANATLVDAFLNWRLSDHFQIRAGKTKSPTGLERIQSAGALAFVERGLPSALVPNRDIGIELHGRILADRAEYSLGLFNGAPDGATVVSDSDDGKDLAARLFLEPFRGGPPAIRGLGFGLAGTHGRHRGTPSRYRTTGQQTFFQFDSGTVNDGLLWRLAPQASYYNGPWGLLAEWTASSQELRRGSSRRALRNTAWQLITAFALSGEANSFRGIRPDHPLDPSQGSWGAFELVGRVGGLRIDPASFPLFANRPGNGDSLLNLGVGINWFLNSNLKFSADYEVNRVSGPSNHRNEHTLFHQLQLAF